MRLAALDQRDRIAHLAELGRGQVLDLVEQFQLPRGRVSLDELPQVRERGAVLFLRQPVGTEIALIEREQVAALPGLAVEYRAVDVGELRQHLAGPARLRAFGALGLDRLEDEQDRAEQ